MWSGQRPQSMDFFRGDEKQQLGPLSSAQWFCLACAAWLVRDLLRRRAAVVTPA